MCCVFTVSRALEAPRKLSWMIILCFLIESPQLTLHFICNLQLQQQLKKMRESIQSFSARLKLELFTTLGIEISLLIIHCMFNRFLYRLQTPKCIKMCCSQRTQKSNMLGSGKGTQGKEVAFVPDPGRWNTL